jgi:uncharacterized protein (DUF58 family)
MSRSRQDPEKLLQRLEWTVIRRLDGLLQGNYRTLFRGVGLDLADLREYQLHDDVRHIDWNVTARLQTPYVREYHEDREISAWFLLDVSSSVDFGSSKVNKRSVLTEFVGVLSRLLTRRGNRVGAMLYDGQRVQASLPAGSGRRQVLQLLQLLQRPAVRSGTAATDLRAFFVAAAQVLTRRSLVFVVSDFISRPGWEKPLQRLTHRNEVLAVRLFDPLESEMPDLGVILLQDSETGEQLWVDTHDPGFRERFAAEAERREKALRSAFIGARVDAIELSTNDDLADSLMRFIDLRRSHGQLAARGALPAHLKRMRVS